jgi:RNA polymerase sigma-70 factor (ECF subfamily)
MMQTIEQGAQKTQERLERLLLCVAGGEQEALEALYHGTRAAVYALALSLLKNTHDAEDVTQDTYVRIWENAAAYRPQGSPMAWILTVARNLARMKLRQGAKYETLDEQQWDAIPAECDLAIEERHLLQTALAKLSDEERQIVLLHAVSGLKHREIARLLEKPLATVLSKYNRALKKLKTQLEGGDAL